MSTYDQLNQLEGILLIPHELLHVAAYRLIGKPCAYQWGQRFVRGLVPLSRNEQVFVWLFPLGVMLTLSFTFYGLSLIGLVASWFFAEATVREGTAIGVQLMATFAGMICMGYSGTSIMDVRKAWQLVFRLGTKH